MTLPDGCFAQVLVDGQRLLKRASIEPREPVARSGSGDAFLAGYLAARYEGRPPDQCLRFGVACGAESTARLGAGLIDPREARRLMGDVELTVVELSTRVAEGGPQAKSRAWMGCVGCRSRRRDVASQERRDRRRTALALRTARTPRRSARSAPSRWACAAAPARPGTVR